jgi:hypothetical protein
MHPVAAHPRIISSQDLVAASANFIRSQITSLFSIGRNSRWISADGNYEDEVGGLSLPIDCNVRKLKRQLKTSQSKVARGTVLGISAARGDNFTEVVNLAAREPVRRLVFGEQTDFCVGLSLVQSTRKRSNVIDSGPSQVRPGTYPLRRRS